jgi:hypothetical protein
MSNCRLSHSERCQAAGRVRGSDAVTGLYAKIVRFSEAQVVVDKLVNGCPIFV